MTAFYPGADAMELRRLFETVDRVLPTLPGWCTLEKAHRLVELAAGPLPTHTIVELGVYGGRSLLALALGASTYCEKPGRHVWGIDPYTLEDCLRGATPAEAVMWPTLDLEDALRKATRAIEENSLGPFATILRCRSIGGYPSHLPDLRPHMRGGIGLLHQDGNHSEAVSVAEVACYLPALPPGGLWVMDDTDVENWPSLRKAQERLLACGMEKIEDHGSWAVFRKP